MLISLFAPILRFLLSLRYRIKIKNLKNISSKEGGILFLPNHPAQVDPLMVIDILGPRFRTRPLVVDHYYFLSGARFFMNLVRAIPVPNFELSSNSWKIKRGEESLAEVKEGLKKGENFLIYPSGHLRRHAHERVGGSSLVHDLLQEFPDARVVLVRTTGLWGSRFSRALTGSAPDFWKALSDGIKTILKNGLFFTPRRDVTMEFEEVGDELPRKGTRLELNRFLDQWYNRYEDGLTAEPVKLVSYSCFKEELAEVTYNEKAMRDKACQNIPDRVREDIIAKVAEISDRDPSSIKGEMDLATDIGFDSLDVAGMLAYLDHKYDTKSNSPGDLHSVYDLFSVAMGEQLGEEEELQNTHWHWPENERRMQVMPPEGATIHEAFLRICDRMGDVSACSDNTIGILSYKRLKKAALVLREKIKKLPGDHIGIMIPASSATYLLILATLLAKKTPVMLNWTAGARALNHAKELTGLKTVLTSRRFLMRADGLDLGDLHDVLVCLEDLKSELTLSEKLSGLFNTFSQADDLLKRFGLNEIGKEEPAVMLFTSGTETLPKAVPLSHDNILENHRSGLSCIDMEKGDVMLGALPPFHSFGFSVTGLLPLLAGFRVFFSPDPTDSNALVSGADQWKVTICCLAPSFYINFFKAAKPDQVKSVRLFVTGAEKAPDELYERVAAISSGKVVEGYGITECSPMVTINWDGQKAGSIGKPLPKIDLCVIHPETEKVLPQGESGEICMRGPNIFNGYYGKDVPDPFIELAGKKWYRSGDMGHIDEVGDVIFEGRLKRFVKIGGEMLSLTAIESSLIDTAKKRGWYDDEHEKVPLALTALEPEDGKCELVLIATFDTSKEEINKALKDAGFPRIAKISHIHKVDEIPITGTGKVHFRALKDLAHA